MARTIKMLFLTLFAAFALVSCDKEMSVENGTQQGGGTSGGGVSGSASFTFDGAPANCVAPVINGTYYAGVALTASNYIQLAVNVTAVGTYAITTSTANGITFSGSGTFASTGTQTVTLTGNGTPISAVTSAFSMGANTCSFLLTVRTEPALTNYLKCKIDGVPVTFNVSAKATYNGTTDTLAIGGLADATSIETLEIDLIGGAPFTTGVYQEEVAGGTAATIVEAGYLSPAADIWYVDINASNPRPHPFKVAITSISATRIQGTFQGGMFDAAGGTAEKLFTEGTFDLPIN